MTPEEEVQGIERQIRSLDEYCGCAVQAGGYNVEWHENGDVSVSAAWNIKDGYGFVRYAADSDVAKLMRGVIGPTLGHRPPQALLEATHDRDPDYRAITSVEYVAKLRVHWKDREP